MKPLLVLALCLYLSACNESSSSAPVSAQSLDAPATGWSAPQTASAIEQEIRGTYYNQTNRNSSFTVASDYSISGSVQTVQTLMLDGMPSLYTTPVVCTFTGHSLMAFPNATPSGFSISVVLDSGIRYGPYMPRDCLSVVTPGEPSFVNIMGFPSEKCIDLSFSTPTATQRYCKD